jgi:glycerol-3-phosphate cytidylyltransferase
MTRGYLASAFDLINVGDLDIIAQARMRCDQLLIGVYTDEYVRALTGRSPVVPLTERVELVRHVRGVDRVVPHEDEPAGGRWHYKIFRIGAREDHPRTAGVHWLEPARQTQSIQVRMALAPSALSEAGNENRTVNGLRSGTDTGVA